jgi:hypothetical protein
LRKIGGKRDAGRWAAGAALRHHVTGATFALTALGGYAKLELDFVKTHAGMGMTGNFTVRNSAADTDNHGGPFE